MAKPKHKYHVTLFKVFYDDWGLESYRRCFYEQDTFATSPKQAVNQVRYNCGLPHHGHVSYCSDNARATIEHKCELVEL